MTLDEFRKNGLLSAELAELLRNQVLRLALEVCDGAAPVNGGAKTFAEPHMAHIQHGIDRGYALYPRVLRLLATKPGAEAEQVEQTYEPVEEKVEV